MLAPITPGPVFRDNLALLPAIDALARADLFASDGSLVASIPNAPGKQGSLAVYQYLHLAFGELGAAAAAHGLAVFAEHTADARARPGAHPNVDLLVTVADGGAPLRIALVSA